MKKRKKQNKWKIILLVILLLGIILIAEFMIIKAVEAKKQKEEQKTTTDFIQSQDEETKGEDDKQSEAEIEPSTTETLKLENTEKIENETTETESGESALQYEKESGTFEEDAKTLWTTSEVNFRKWDNTECEVIKVLPANTQVEQIADSTDWAKVSYQEQTGYISKKYLSDEKPQEEVPAAGSNVGASQRTPGVIVIDAGHQKSGDNTKEPNGPGSSTMKARVTGGARGVATGVYEYQLNLQIAQKLKQELENRGYTIYMTRETHDVNMSNKERAEYASTVNADICIRIHANSCDDTKVAGAMTLAPSDANPYVASLAPESQKLSKCIVDAYCDATGLRNRGVVTSDTMTGINWCTMPVTILEMGFMSNSTEDINMEDENFQTKMVQGIADGVDNYYQ